MEYRQYGKTDMRVSRFGLGCMRFPEDENESIRMVHYAIDHGVNYLDTAYAYQNSETLVGKALRGGYRQKTYLATKSPVWRVKQHSDFEKFLDEELRRLCTDHIDVYLLHNLYCQNWEIVRRFDGLKFLDDMVRKGKIRHKACSIHSTLAAFKEIVDAFDWDMVQLQLNILDVRQQAGVEGLQHVGAKGIAAVIMEPLRGGEIINRAPAEVLELIRRYPEQRSLADWCFRFLYDMPEVSVILSGTHTMEQLQENLAIFDHSAPGVMSDADQQLIARIRGIYESKGTIGCTGCRYCMPCPQGVEIPEVFKLYNSYQFAKPHKVDLLVYNNALVPAGKGADRCMRCGLCAAQCPQSLDIPALLAKVHSEITMELH